MFPLSLYGGPILLMVVIVCLFASIKILRQYERARSFLSWVYFKASKAPAR